MNAIDRIVWRNEALWDFLNGPEDQRKAAFIRAFGEPCPHCDGTGSQASGTSYGGVQEMLECDFCGGVGATDRESVK